MFSKIILVQKNLFLSQKENSEHLVEVVWGALLYISITPPPPKKRLGIGMHFSFFPKQGLSFVPLIHHFFFKCVNLPQ